MGNLLADKFHLEYHDIPDFLTRTKCPISKETVRRVIYQDKPVSPHILAILGRYLGISPMDIRQILIDAGDKELFYVIGTDNAGVPEWQRGLIDAVSVIRSKTPDAMNIIADQLNIIAQANGLKIAQHTDKVRVSKKTMRGPGKRKKEAS